MHWQKLDREQTTKVINAVQSPENHGMISMGTSEVKRAKARFYENYDIYKVTNYASLPSFTFEFISDGQFFNHLDGTETPIYVVNDKGELQLTDQNVLDYLEFYCDYVPSDDGDITLIVNPKDMPLLDSLDEEAYNAVFSHYKPPSVSYDASGMVYTVEADLYLESHMVRAKIEITHKGRVKIVEQHSQMQQVMKAPASETYL